MHFSTHLDVDLVALEAEDQVTVMLELAAPAAVADAQRPPAAVMVVLDRSGSMAGERLEVAKAAIDALIGRLAPADRLGVVTFDDEVRVVVPCGPLGDATDAATVRQAVAGIGPGGMTNLSGGLLRGLQELRRAAGDDSGTLVLLSDGHANVGEVDADRLGAVTAKARGRRVTTSTIGVGLDYDEMLLSALARGGAGNAHFAEEADTAGAQLAGEIDGLLNVTAQAASLLVSPAAGVETVTVWNDIPGIGVDGGVMLELGDLVAGEHRKLVLTLAVPALAALGLAKIADLRLTWVALPDLVEHTIDVPLHVNVVPGDDAAGRIPDPTVTSELAFQKAQRTKRDAARALREGRLDEASDLYRDAGLDLRGAAAAAPASTAHELHLEADTFEDLAIRATTDDARRVAKAAEADSAVKSRKRGRRPGE